MPPAQSKSQISQPVSVNFSAIDQLDPIMRGRVVLQRFQRARDMQGFREANLLWGHVKPAVLKTEAAKSCSDYENGDMDLAKDIIEDITKKPIKLIIAICAFLYAFGGADDEETVKALKDILKELRDHLIDYGEEKAGDALAKQFRKRIGDKLRTLLLKYLQSVSKRSRKHFNEVLDNLFGVARGLGEGTLLVGRIMFTPSNIAPDWCGLVDQIKQARFEAFQRIFGYGLEQAGKPAYQWMLLPPPPPVPSIGAALLPGGHPDRGSVPW